MRDIDFLMQTRDPVVKIAPDLSAIVLELRQIQPRLHKRRTKNIDAKQLEYIMGETSKIFSRKPDNVP